jgi:hypothetical protein
MKTVRRGSGTDSTSGSLAAIRNGGQTGNTGTDG